MTLEQLRAILALRGTSMVADRESLFDALAWAVEQLAAVTPAKKPRFGDGSIAPYLRGRIYWIRWKDARGVIQRESTRTGDIKEAKAVLLRRIKEVGAGKTATAAQERVLVTQIADTYLESMVNRASYASLVSPIRRIKEYFAGWKAHSVTIQDVRAFKEWLEQHFDITPPTINRHLSALSAMYALAIREERISVRPQTASVKGKESPAKQTYFTHPEFNAFRSALPEQYRDLFDFLGHTGRRIRQVGLIEIRDVHLEQGYIECRPETVKNREVDIIPLVGVAEKVVRQAWGNRRLGCPYLFHHEGAPLFYASERSRSRSTPFNRAWAAAQKATGIYKTPHDLCRTYMRMIDAAGVRGKMRGLLFGRKSSAIQDRYSVQSIDDLRVEAQRVADVIDAQPDEQGTLLSLGGKR